MALEDICKRDEVQVALIISLEIIEYNNERLIAVKHTKDLKESERLEHVAYNLYIY